MKRFQKQGVGSALPWLLGHLSVVFLRPWERVLGGTETHLGHDVLWIRCGSQQTRLVFYILGRDLITAGHKEEQAKVCLPHLVPHSDQTFAQVAAQWQKCGALLNDQQVFLVFQWKEGTICSVPH